MWVNLLIDDFFLLALFCIVYDAQATRGEFTPILSRYYYLELFETLKIKIMSLVTLNKNSVQYNLLKS